MSNPSWFRAIISGLIGMAIGVVFVAVANLASPIANLIQVLVVVCLPAFISALVGHVIGARRKNAP
jgi:hypothetical protein